jgi:hypothetical protein
MGVRLTKFFDLMSLTSPKITFYTLIFDSNYLFPIIYGKSLFMKLTPGQPLGHADAEARLRDAGGHA